MKYRAEIDGLRALAVIPVIFFHAGFELFNGGYVGVDVFFVISGYLITTIILSEKERGTFSLAHFYERRARRILPALFLVMLVSLPAAWLWLPLEDMEDFSQSLAAVSTYTSNFLFWHESGYWEVASELKPLLHTWSLAVEEQYYLLFPLFLMAMWQFGKRWIVASFLLIAAASLALAQWGSREQPEATFYLLHTRAWELAIGAGIAFYFLYRKQVIRSLLSHPYVNEVLSLLGLLMIAYAVFAFDSTIPFPGFYALVPTVGTGLIILFSSPQTLVGRLLGTKMLVGVGLISYSAYLWHYPLFVFARHRSLTEPGELQFTVLAGLSFLLAYLSWRYVERPFRSKGVFSRKQIFTFALVASLFFISVGTAGHLNEGWPGRFGEELLRFLPDEVDDSKCESDKFQTEKICRLVDNPNKLSILIGDSHAGSIAPEMRAAFSESGIGLMHLAMDGCPPILNVYRADGGKTSDLSCHEFNQEMYRYITQSEEIETVVMLARWTLLMEGTRFNNGEGGVETSKRKPHWDLMVNGQPEYHPAYDHRSGIADRIADSVQLLLDAGKKVILIYPVPEAGWKVPNHVAKSFMMNPEAAFQADVGSTGHDLFKERNRRAYEALDGIGQHASLYRVYPEKILCNAEVEDRCIVQKDGRSLYRDDDHLSNFGSSLLVEQVIYTLNNP